MKLLMTKFLALILFVTTYYGVRAQGDYKVHSHNDYQHEYPFWNAYVSGATSIEVDIFLKNGNLYVAHETHEIAAKKTLETLYLEKLKGLMHSENLREIQLLIDIKSEAYSTLDKLIALLEKYPMLLKSGKVRFVISGNRPKLADYKNYPDYILFDHQNLNDLGTSYLEKVALISLSFKDFSVWNGYGRIVEPELITVKKAIQKAHNFKKPFRFWDTPDTKTAWARFSQLGVDYINTDKPEQVSPYLEKLDTNSLENTVTIDAYVPKYKHNSENHPTNIILMVGDGNGLGQITAAMIANKGQLTILGIKDIGLVKTAAYDDLITDSAAGGTAIATGFKTNNRAIGVGPDGKALKNILEYTRDKGFNTGIITTDDIFGATPASFYAHRIERNNTEGILEDLNNSSLAFFITSGKREGLTTSNKFVTQELEAFESFKQPTAVYLKENQDGKGLSKSVKKALQVLSAKKEPFFLMVEGAKIDNGGHANDINMIVEEMFDFDLAIAEALRFSDASKNTLVIITADHETSGLGIVGGEEAKGIIRGDFLSLDHTGIMVPLFAYGPMADRFTGTYENTEIYWKILSVLGWRTK